MTFEKTQFVLKNPKFKPTLQNNTPSLFEIIDRYMLLIISQFEAQNYKIIKL